MRYKYSPELEPVFQYPRMLLENEKSGIRLCGAQNILWQTFQPEQRKEEFLKLRNYCTLRELKPEKNKII